MGAGQHAEPEADVLQSNPRRPDQQRQRDGARHVALPLDGWRQVVRPGRGQRHARRSPRGVDRPEERRPHHPRLRRRHLRHLRRVPQLGPSQPRRDRAVLPRGLQQRPELPRLRRPAGQRHLGLPDPWPDHRRARGAGRAQDLRRRRLLLGARPDGPEHRLLRISVRRHAALGPPHRRSQLHQATRSQGRTTAALQLEHADRHLSARAAHDLHRQPTPAPVSQPRRRLDHDQRRPDDQRRRQKARRRAALHDHDDRRVAPARGPAVGRHRRRQSLAD
mgnify:CR=1 FL=1